MGLRRTVRGFCKIISIRLLLPEHPRGAHAAIFCSPVMRLNEMVLLMGDMRGHEHHAMALADVVALRNRHAPVDKPRLQPQRPQDSGPFC